MKADPQVQRRLLDLQAIDTNLAQLAHRRRSLPERAELESLARELSSMEDERVRAQVAVDDLDRDIARLEKDVEQVRARKEKDENRLAAGTGPARELEALQHELVSLKRRQGDLEDAELELMEQRETAQGVLDGVEQRLAETRDKRAATEQRRDEALAEIAKEEEFKRGPVSRSPATSRATWSTSTTRSARTPGWVPRCSPRAAAAGAAWTCPAPTWPGSARQPPTTWSAARTADGSWSVPTSRACRSWRHAWSPSRPTVGPGAIPAPPATARWSATRRPVRCSPSDPSRSARPPTTSPSTRA